MSWMVTHWRFQMEAALCDVLLSVLSGRVPNAARPAPPDAALALGSATDERAKWHRSVPWSQCSGSWVRTGVSGKS